VGAQTACRVFPKWGSPVAPSITLDEILCTALLRWAGLHAKFLFPNQFCAPVLEARMLHPSWRSLCRSLTQYRVGVLF